MKQERLQARKFLRYLEIGDKVGDDREENSLFRKQIYCVYVEIKVFIQSLGTVGGALPRVVHFIAVYVSTVI
jgi:hypothetical protein